MEIEVCDITGMSVMSVFQGKSSQGMNLQSIDVQRLAPGTYWVRIKTEESQIARPFVVMH
jgi:hypothetical protein